MGVYCVSKAAVLMLTEVLAVELAPLNIQVNAIAPGFVKTRFSAAIWDNPMLNEATLASIPQRRMAEPVEIAGMALYLAAPASNFTTGATLLVDGGQAISSPLYNAMNPADGVSTPHGIHIWSCTCGPFQALRCSRTGVLADQPVDRTRRRAHAGTAVAPAPARRRLVDPLRRHRRDDDAGHAQMATSAMPNRFAARLTASRACLRPFSVTRRPETVGTWRGEWISTPRSRPDCVILYLHGGGYVSGSPATHRAVITNLAQAAEARVFALDYRLAPEYPFPAALEDAWGAYWWLLCQGIAPGQIVVAGDSAGGGLTVALMLALRAAGMPLPAGGACLSPWFDLALTGASIDDEPGNRLSQLRGAECVGADVPG